MYSARMEYQKTYAGIGSRDTPSEILETMKDIAALCHDVGYTLNSGGADGADSAFEQGALSVGGSCNIFLPWPKFNGHHSTYTRPKPEAYEIAASIHPIWQHLGKDSVRSLIARNMHQVLGWSLKDPVEFVVCWTFNGQETAKQYTLRSGGTGSAISLADSLGIPVFNLCNDGRVEDLVEFIIGRQNGSKT